MDIVKANLILKSKDGMSVVNDSKFLSAKTVKSFLPSSSHIDKLVNQLTSAGFTIESQSNTLISISGESKLFDDAFAAKMQRKTTPDSLSSRGLESSTSFFESATAMQPDRFSNFLEFVEPVTPIIYFDRPSATPPTPSPNFYFLNVLNNVPALLGSNVVNTAGITGNGVRVSMLDTGFVIRYTEVVNVINSTTVNATDNLRHVNGVWLTTDPSHSGTNFFTGGSFSGNTISLGTALPPGTTTVEIEISAVHPHYINQGYTIGDLRATPGQDMFSDSYGHGCAEAANILAVAPGATLSFVSMGPSISNPVTAFQLANINQNPDIITCSWGTSNRTALYLEVASTVAAGKVVIFAAGNGHTDSASSLAVAHPDIISVGGTYPIQGGGFRASNYSSSYDSAVFTNPLRHAPDITGLVGETPRAALIMLPTQPENTMDNSGSISAFPNGDNTANDDGWVVVSGTSAAAPQVAGVCALLLQQHPNLTPDAVKNILENTAVDVTTGSSNSAGPDIAAIGWDDATGFGLVNANNAVNFLGATFNAYIRDSVEDNGTEPTVATRLYTSPDIIVSNSIVANPEDTYGLTVKHRDDLSDDPELGQDNFVYLRVQNRSTVTGNCTATVYVTDPGMLSNPSSWTVIGSTSLNNLTPGEFRVSAPITWTAANIPGLGHYCMIAILDSTADPAPNLSSITTPADFSNMVKNQNNVAWKNLNIVNVFSGGVMSHFFHIDGPQGTGNTGTLEIDLTNFASGSEVYVKILRRLGDTAGLENATHHKHTSRYRYLKLTTGSLSKLKNMPLNSNESSKVTINYKLANPTSNGEYPIVSTFKVNSIETGKYTELVRVMSFNFVGNRNSKEFHKANCPWVKLMSPGNKIAFNEMRIAHRKGFDNCGYCLGDSKR
ncbi:MAG: S8 family serine peptidase [Saprospiraceae bacterium]|nr:S8 family serine peptidase [Saprospiraceae bacterium]